MPLYLVQRQQLLNNHSLLTQTSQIECTQLRGDRQNPVPSILQVTPIKLNCRKYFSTSLTTAVSLFSIPHSSSIQPTQRHLHSLQFHRQIPYKQAQKRHNRVCARHVSAGTAGNAQRLHSQVRLTVAHTPELHLRNELCLRKSDSGEIGIKSGAKAVEKVERIDERFTFS